MNDLDKLYKLAIEEKNYSLALKIKELQFKLEKSSNKIILTKDSLKDFMEAIDKEIDNLSKN